MFLMSDALYHGLVGAGGCLICYLFYTLLVNLWHKFKSWRKNDKNTNLNEVKVQTQDVELESSTEQPKHVDSLTNNENSSSKDDVPTAPSIDEDISSAVGAENKASTHQADDKETKKLRPLISDKALSKLNDKIKPIIRFFKFLLLYALVAGVVFIFGLLFWDVTSNINEYYHYDRKEFHFWIPFIFAFLIPLILYTFKKISLKSFFKWAAVLSVLAIIICFGILHLKNRYANKRIAEAQEISNKEYIQRKFFGCSFGEKNIEKKLIEQGYTIRESHPNYFEINHVNFGGYEMDTVCFYYYKNKFYKIWLKKNYSYKDEEYNVYLDYGLISSDIEQEYNDVEWEADNRSDRIGYHYPPYFEHNNNTWRDKHTELNLYNFHDKNCLVLIYYDRDSGYEEDQEEERKRIRDDF